MAARKVVEAMPVFVSSALGFLYVAFLVKPLNIVLLVIFGLLLIRSTLGLLR